MKTFIRNWHQELAGAFVCTMLGFVGWGMLSEAQVAEANDGMSSDIAYVEDYYSTIYTEDVPVDITNKKKNKQKKSSDNKKKKNNNKSITTHVHLTCYQPVEAQCNADPLHTADGSFIDLRKLKKGDIKWVAISRDIESIIPMGSKVRITSEKTGECYGVFLVKDRMNKRWNHRMDILIHPDSKFRISEKNVKVELVI